MGITGMKRLMRFVFGNEIFHIVRGGRIVVKKERHENGDRCKAFNF
jgi:hypothetical protein